MDYVKLGSTGLDVSPICVGCMSFGAPGRGNHTWTLDEDQARPLIRDAIEAGINFFDTADMYSVGVSEEVTGRALRELGNLDEIVLATKVFNPMSPGPNMGGLARKHIVQACEASLRRLGVETIDLYQIHRFDRLTPSEYMSAVSKKLMPASMARRKNGRAASSSSTQGRQREEP